MERESGFSLIKPNSKNKTRFKLKITFPKSLRYLMAFSIPAGNSLQYYEGFKQHHFFTVEIQGLSYQHLDLQYI